MNGNPQYASDPHQALNQCVEVVPEVPDDPSFFQRTDWLSFLITAVLALAVYLFTLAPEVTLEYSGIYATGAMYGGVPHAGGYPLWTIYAWLSTKLLPFSNIAWRVGVSSAVAAALACGITALMVSRGGALILEGIAGSSRLRPKEENLLRMVSGYVAGMAFGFDGAFWGNAVTVETWPLTLLLFSIVLCFVMRWLAAPEKTRYLSAAALAYGLTLTTSQALAIAALGLQFVILLGNRAVGRDIFLATTLLVIACLIARTREFFPGILHVLRVDSLWRGYVCIGIATGLMCIGLTLRTRSILTRWRTVVAVGFFLATGLSVYLYVPTVSMTNPPMNWGYARTVEGFVQTLSRGQFEGIRPTDSLARLVAGMRFYTDIALSEFGLLFFLPALLPFAFLHRMTSKARTWLLGLVAVYLCLSLFMVAMLDPPPDKAARGMLKEFFAPSFLILALWTGYGLVLIGTVTARIRKPS